LYKISFYRFHFFSFIIYMNRKGPGYYNSLAYNSNNENSNNNKPPPLTIEDKNELDVGTHYYYKREGQTWIFNGIFDGYAGGENPTFKKWKGGASVGLGRVERDPFHPNQPYTETQIIESIWTLSLPDAIIEEITKYGGKRQFKRRRKTRRKRRRRKTRRKRRRRKTRRRKTRRRKAR